MNETLQTNLDALDRAYPECAQNVRRAVPSPRLTPVTTRDGQISLEIQGGRALHSRYNPDREARRLLQTAISDRVATVVLLGLGAGFVLRRLLLDYPAVMVVVVERSWSTIRTILATINLAEDLTGERLVLTVDPIDLQRRLQSYHQPLIRPGLVVLPLVPWTEDKENRQHFQDCRAAVEVLLRTEERERFTIARFGLRWLVHSIHNSRYMTDRATTRETKDRLCERIATKRVTVVAAGPGLDQFLERRRVAPGDLLVSVDTALPALLQRGITPDAVVVLDPQAWSVLHLRGSVPERTILLLDGGVVPAVARQVPAGSVLWFFGSHPLHQLLYLAGAPLHIAPGSPESVTEAAVLLVRAAGAAEVTVAGADGGYPRGTTYAAGTYHHTVANRGAYRLLPESHFFARTVYPHTRIHDGEHRASAEGPFFSTGDMSNRTERIRLARETAVSPLETHPGDREFAPSRFWADHAGELAGTIDRLRALGGPGSTPVPSIMRALGPHGIAHLPVFGRLNRDEFSPDTLIPRLIDTFRTVQGFILAENRRYS